MSRVADVHQCRRRRRGVRRDPMLPPRTSREMTLEIAAKEYVWLWDRRHGSSLAAIAAREGVSIGRVRFGLARARAQEKGAVTTRAIRPPRLVPLFPIGAYTPQSTCAHRRPIEPGSSLCCMVCHTSGMDRHPALRRDPRSEPAPEPKPKPAPELAAPARDAQGAQAAIVWRPTLSATHLNHLLFRFMGCGSAASGTSLMFISRMPAWSKAGRTLAIVIASALVGGIVTIGGFEWLRSHNSARPSQPPRDAQFAALGRAYLPQLAEAYASAWNDGASALDSGQPISAALDLVGKNWTSGRTALFDKVVAPEFAKIVPESVSDSDVTQQERTAMVAAWRGFAAGLAR